MSLTLLASNNASTVLASSINASATTLTVNTGAGNLFPSPVAGTSFFKLTLIDAATGQLTEIVHVTARTGDVMTIERAQEGTAARAWSANDIAANMMTAGTLSYILGSFQPLDATLTALASLIGAADKLPYFNGDDTAALTPLTSVGRDIIGKSTISDVLTYLNLQDASGYSGRLLAIKSITASGNYTPTTGTKKILVVAVGGGGGGGGTYTTNSTQVSVGAGGGGGGCSVSLLNTSSLTFPIAVTIGAGGSAGGIAAAGGTGGTTIFGTMSSTGGAGGDTGRLLSSTTASITFSGGGGVGSGGNIFNASGTSGMRGFATPGGLESGEGGSSYFTAGGGPITSSSAAQGNNGTLGAGGGGGFTPTASAEKIGGAGGTGIVMIWEYQ